MLRPETYCNGQRIFPLATSAYSDVAFYFEKSPPHNRQGIPPETSHTHPFCFLVLSEKGRELRAAGARLAPDRRAHGPYMYTARACPGFTNPLQASYLEDM